jgi:hypothetical protein
MNRRTALWLSMISGGLLWPASLLAQDRDRDSDRGEAEAPKAKSRRGGRAAAAASKAERSLDDEADVEPPAQAGGEQGPPANFPTEPGHSWRTVDISRYTGLPHAADASPQTALIEWIFRRTGSAVWHGDKIAVLCASRTQLRAYHNATVLKQVDEMLERFLDATSDFLAVHVQVVKAVDPRWRYLVYSRLTPLPPTGPQGQQVWTLSVKDAATVMAQMQINQGFELVVDQKLKIVNGQTFAVRRTGPVGYKVGAQRDGAVGLGFQPATAQLEEGVVVRMSPLLTYEGDELEAAIDLRANVVRRLHSTRIFTRRELGPSDLEIDVPEVSETRLNQTYKKWKLNQTLLISAGIQPGILGSKGGFLNLRIPGTVPTSTELLVFVDITTAAESPRTARARD